MAEQEIGENAFHLTLLKSLEDDSLENEAFGRNSTNDEQPKNEEGMKRLSQSASPLLDTGHMHSDDPTICPYCNKKFRKPRVLDCLHSMCEDCVIAQLGGDSDNRKSMNHKLTDFELEHNANTSRPTPPGVIRCPVCSQETHIGNDIMFVNLMLLDYVRIREIGLNGRGDERICRACKSEEAAVANCLHCCSDLCNKCVQAHHDMRMFDGHKVEKTNNSL
uniref:B box-type domain-containing protein n=1 Tax=Globodera pallida TaxID=36090 RepID=A0A183C3Q1_GLOPA